jgi:hypothetical protein
MIVCGQLRFSKQNFDLKTEMAIYANDNFPSTKDPYAYKYNELGLEGLVVADHGWSRIFETRHGSGRA